MNLDELNKLYDKKRGLELSIKAIEEIFDNSKNYGLKKDEEIVLQITHKGKNHTFPLPVKAHKKIKNAVIKTFQDEIDLIDPTLSYASQVLGKVGFPKSGEKAAVKSAKKLSLTGEFQSQQKKQARKHETDTKITILPLKAN